MASLLKNGLNYSARRRQNREGFFMVRFCYNVFTKYICVCCIIAGCSSANTGVLKAHAENTQRAPAQSALSSLPILTNLPSNFYKGPIAVQIDDSKRAPAKIFLPLQYKDEAKWPLVILLHGLSGTAKTEDAYLGLSYRVSRRGFILLAPEGMPMPIGTTIGGGQDLGGNQFWNATDFCCDLAKTDVDDVSYLLHLLEYAKKTYKVDSERVYIIGHSNGGFMANRLGCEAGKHFAAMASLAGGAYDDLKKCRVLDPVSYLQIHAVDDPTVLYKENKKYSGGVETISQWLTKDGCVSTVQTEGDKDFVYLIPGLDTKKEHWRQCSSGKDVALWTIRPFVVAGHNPHVPLFNLNFMESVLDFLLSHKLP